MPGTPAIRLHQLVLRFGERVVLDHVDLDVLPGEVVAVVGVSGAGKSTLLLSASGLVPTDEGLVYVEGLDITALTARERDRVRGRKFGFVFQFGELVPELSLVENVALPLRLTGIPKAKATTSAAIWLDRLGIGDLAERSPVDVSGGEMQRAAIARAMVHSPSVVLADEPTGALDDENARVVFDLLLEATRGSNASVLLATHDRELAAQADRAYHLTGGCLVPC